MSADTRTGHHEQEQPPRWGRVELGGNFFAAQIIKHPKENDIKTALAAGEVVYVRADTRSDWYYLRNRLHGTEDWFPFGEVSQDEEGNISFQNMSMSQHPDQETGANKLYHTNGRHLSIDFSKGDVVIKGYKEYGKDVPLPVISSLMIRNLEEGEEALPLMFQEDYLVRLLMLSQDESLEDFGKAMDKKLEEMDEKTRESNKKAQEVEAAQQAAKHLEETAETIRRARETSPWSKPE